MGGRSERNRAEGGHAVRIRIDEGDLALVPGGEQLRVGQATDQARMDQPGEAHARDVAGLGEHALEVPDPVQ